MNKRRGEKVIIIGHFTFEGLPRTQRQLEAGRAQVVGATRTGRKEGAGSSGPHIRAHTSLTGKCWYCRVIKLDTKLTNLDTTWVLTDVHLLGLVAGWRGLLVELATWHVSTLEASSERKSHLHSAGSQWTLDAPASTHTLHTGHTHTHTCTL